MEDPYFVYIAAAYGVTFVAIAGLVAWVVLERRAARRALARAERAADRVGALRA